MKTLLVFTITLLFTLLLNAQEGINYKAVLADDAGDLIINSPVQVRFRIYEDFDQTLLYYEQHNITTDDSGKIILNIGTGNAQVGDFDTIYWPAGSTFLNVQIIVNGILRDFGTTPFNNVPYAYHSQTAAEALNVQGLERVNEGNGDGWRLIGQSPVFYGNIGRNATDLSINAFNSTVLGATGEASFAAGAGNEAFGNYSVSLGLSNTSTGPTSFTANGFNEATTLAATAFGYFTEATGFYSFSLGNNTRAESVYSMAIGRFNIGGGNSNLTIATDPLFEIGNGSSDINRNNAVTVLKNGNVGIGTATPQEPLHILGRLRVGTETIEDTGNNRLSFNAGLLPDSDSGFALGNSSFRWSSVWAVDGTINTSDRRDKENINELNYGLKEIQKLKPVSFNWKKRPEAGVKLGLIAQDLQEIIPEVVMSEEIIYSEDDSTTFEKKPLDRMGVYYSDLTPVLIKAIQEQQEIIENLQNQVNELKSVVEGSLNN